MAVIDTSLNIPSGCVRCEYCETRDDFKDSFCRKLRRCFVTQDYISYRLDDCPLKEVNECKAEDCISKNDAICIIQDMHGLARADVISDAVNRIIAMPSVTPQEPKTGHCKDCKWWKDKDGVYRRGIGAESKCPINRREVMEGMGYCFMFEPQESEVEDGNDN